MNAIELFVQEQGTTTYAGFIQLDLSGKETVKFNKSIQDISDPQIVTSAYTQKFTVKNTPKNGLFLKNAFTANGMSFNPSQKCKAYININGAYFTTGYIQLESILRDDSDGDVEYEIQFFGETSTFASNVGLKKMSDLNLSALSHDRTRNNIFISWFGWLMDGNVLYPLAEYGYTYDEVTKQPVDSTLSLYNPAGAVGTVSTKGFTNSANLLRIDQFYPYIRVKYLWDKIFADAGFTYTSNFLGTPGVGGIDMWRKMYMVAQGDPGIDFIARFRNVVYGPYHSSTPHDFFTKIDAPTVIKDPSRSYTGSTSTYKVPVAGTYTFRLSDMISTQMYLYALTPGSQRYIILYLLVNGVTVAGRIGYTTNSLAGAPSSYFTNYIYADTARTITVFDFAGVTLAAGDEVQIWLYCPSDRKFGYFEMVQGQWELVLPTIFDPTSTMPKQYKQIDFIKGINDRFKLMWTPDPANPKNFLIEPWIDWINQGSKLDWSNKLDESKSILITPLFSKLEKQITFKDSEEADIYNKSYQEKVKETFGTLIKDSGLPTITGNKDITSIFAPYPLAPIGGAEKFLVPHLAKDTDTERQPIEIKPRLCFYNGMVSAPYNWFEPGGSLTQYPLTSSYYPGLPFNSNSFDLHWGNNQQFWKLSEVGTGVGDGLTGKTSFSVYWKKWFDYNYHPQSKVMEATFALDFNDISQLKFNDKILIKDSYWMPVKIMDYSLDGKNATKVQLVKYAEDSSIGSPFLLPPAEGPIAGFSVIPTIAGTTVIPDPGYYFPEPDGGTSPDPIQEREYFYPIQGLYYGTTDCEACCHSYFEGERTLYGTTQTMIIGSTVYAIETGEVYAPAGWYNIGGYSYEVDSLGTIISEYDCSSCDCDVTGLTGVMAAFEPTLCEVCCTSTYSTTVWHNGTGDLSTATAIYGDSLGTTPAGAGWYKENGSPVLNDTPLRVSELDGITVAEYGNCDLCDCGQSPNRPLNTGIFTDYGTGNDGCCIENSIGWNTFYQNNADFQSSTLFFYDPTMATDPVGIPPVQVSNGEYYLQVNSGTAEPSVITCDYTVPCPGRTEVVGVVINNATGVDLQFNTRADITYDLQSFFWANSITSLGDTFADTLDTNYAQSSYARFTITSIEDPLHNPPIDNVCDLTFQFWRSGELVYQERVDMPGTYISPMIQVGDTGTCEVTIDFTIPSSP